jgi:hypothetical protein
MILTIQVLEYWNSYIWEYTSPFLPPSQFQPFTSSLAVMLRVSGQESCLGHNIQDYTKNIQVSACRGQALIDLASPSRSTWTNGPIIITCAIYGTCRIRLQNRIRTPRIESSMFGHPPFIFSAPQTRLNPILEANRTLDRCPWPSWRTVLRGPLVLGVSFRVVFISKLRLGYR